MSILVRGVEMPTSCWDCYFQDCGNCILSNYKVVDKCIIEDCIDDDCPLVPVPPHGALMDRDDFFAICPELVNGYKTITDDCVVIPAEEGE